MIKKVVFRDLGSTIRYTAIGGIRFFQNDVLIESGEELITQRTYGETTNFILESSNSWTANDYWPLVAFSTSRRQVGAHSAAYSLAFYWLYEGLGNELSCTFKEPVDSISKIEFNPRPTSSHTDRSVTLPFFIDFFDESGSLIKTLPVTPIALEDTLQTIIIQFNYPVGTHVMDLVNFEVSSSIYSVDVSDNALLAGSLLAEASLMSESTLGLNTLRMFRLDLQSNTSYNALGGVRFYRNGLMINSGSLISNIEDYGETDNFIARRIGGSYNNSYYGPGFMVESAKPTSGSYTARWYDISSSKPCSWEVVFKEPQSFPLTVSFVVNPSGSSSHRTDGVFYVEAYDEYDSLYESIVVTASTSADDSQVVEFVAPIRFSIIRLGEVCYSYSSGLFIKIPNKEFTVSDFERFGATSFPDLTTPVNKLILLPYDIVPLGSKFLSRTAVSEKGVSKVAYLSL